MSSDNKEGEIRERVAVLESKTEGHGRVHEEILLELKAIRAEMAKYKGFMGGITFVISGIVVIVSLAKGWLIGK